MSRKVGSDFRECGHLRPKWATNGPSFPVVPVCPYPSQQLGEAEDRYSLSRRACYRAIVAQAWYRAMVAKAPEERPVPTDGRDHCEGVLPRQVKSKKKGRGVCERARPFQRVKTRGEWDLVTCFPGSPYCMDAKRRCRVLVGDCWLLETQALPLGCAAAFVVSRRPASPAGQDGR